MPSGPWRTTGVPSRSSPRWRSSRSNTHRVGSIWILSLHFAPISLNANFVFSNNTEPCTLPKQTGIPEVSDMECVLTRSMLDGNVPAVVRRTSWKEYSIFISIPACLVDVLVIVGEGTADTLRYRESEGWLWLD